MGVVTASSGRRLRVRPAELEKLWSKGSEYVSAYQSFAWFYAVNTGQISIRHGMRGPSGVLVTEQAGGLDALGARPPPAPQGHRLMVTGGVDASLCPWGWVAQLASGRLSTQRRPGPRLPALRRATRAATCRARAARSWSLEDADAAARAAAPRVYGEIAGYARHLRPAARHAAAPPGLRRAAELALADAGLDARRHRRRLRRRGRRARARPGRGRGHHRAVRPARGAGHRAQDDDRPAVRRRGRARRRRRAAVACATASSRRPSTSARPPTDYELDLVHRSAPRAASAPRWCWPAAAAASTPRPSSWGPGPTDRTPAVRTPLFAAPRCLPLPPPLAAPLI